MENIMFQWFRGGNVSFDTLNSIVSLINLLGTYCKSIWDWKNSVKWFIVVTIEETMRNLWSQWEFERIITISNAL